jgi:cell wall-associated NlpC family hydrolase
MSEAAKLSQAALALIGTPFRLHGRLPDHGLDCVGVIAAAMRIAGRECELPTGYRLRTGEWPDADDWAMRHGFVPATGPCHAGDILMVRPGPAQLHLAIVRPDATGVVEAHASLRKVVLGPLPPAHSIQRTWRLRPVA